MSEIAYGFVKNLDTATSYDDAVEEVTAALKDEGFGVLTTIDVKATLKEKLDVDFRRYIILGACNPPLAHQALEAEAHVGLLLPCNAVVQETDNGVVVSLVDPNALFEVAGTDKPGMNALATEVAARLHRVLDALK